MLAHPHDVAPFPLGEQVRMAPSHGKTLGNTGQSGLFFACKCGFHLSEHPRVALSAASDHDRVAACLLTQGDRIGTAAHVPVPHDGDDNAALDLRDDVPISAPAVELLGEAPVYGDGARARGFHPACKFGGLSPPLS